MFTNLKIPDSSARYEWEENHFKAPKLSSIQLPPEFIDITKEEGRKRPLLVSAVEPLLPEFSLIPPIPPNSEAKAALTRNIAKEKTAL